MQSFQKLLLYGLPACFRDWPALLLQAHLHASPALQEAGLRSARHVARFQAPFVAQSFGTTDRPCALTLSAAHWQGSRNTICHLLATAKNAILLFYVWIAEQKQAVVSFPFFSRSRACGAGAAAAGGVAASQTDELTFLRGLVMTDVNGLATFETIFPGRYTGRTPHIHAKVHAHNLLYLLFLSASCS